ncbi:DUF4401 domain-containing protein [Motilimonas sp. KMU-193]|uniref:DUF4401 domain-containing protein n=1 Tax=Motilimonas sp. KMU-193 TaxID=3388668 RepID=UPI00396B3A75
MESNAASLWQKLQQAECVNKDTAMPAELAMPPWYLGILQGFAGWVAALFLLGFMGSFLALLVSDALEHGIIVFASIFVVFGVVLDRNAKVQKVFVAQFAMVFGLSGLLGIGWGLAALLDYRHELIWFTLFAVLLMTHTYFINNRLNIFLNGVGIAACISGILYQWHWLSLMPLVILFLALLLSLNLGKLGAHYGRLTTLVYAFASWTLLAQCLLSLGLNELDFFATTLAQFSLWSSLLPWSLSVLASLLVVRQILSEQQQALSSKVGMVAMGSVLLLGLMSIPLAGLSSAALFLLLGLQRQDKVLSALAIVSIPLFIASYYYSLSVSLLEKSLLLTALGIFLLLVRWAVSKLFSQHLTKRDESPMMEAK